MTDRVEEFEDALTLMDSAARLLKTDDCPFEVAAHLDYAVQRLADHLGCFGDPSLRTEGKSGHWLN